MASDQKLILRWSKHRGREKNLPTCNMQQYVIELFMFAHLK